MAMPTGSLNPPIPTTDAGNRCGKVRRAMAEDVGEVAEEVE